MTDTDSLDDNELISRCLSGEDETAWESFVRKYSKLIWSSIHKTFRSCSFAYSDEDTEDIYSSLFLSLIENDFKKLRQFRAENACTLRTWLTVITVRMTIDHMRKDKGSLFAENKGEDRDILETVPDKRYGADGLLEERQMNETLGRAVEDLSPGDKRLYDLLYRRGVSAEEAAGILGLPVANIYSRRHRIIKKIKKNTKEM